VSLSIVLRPEAEEEIHEAYQWYQEQSPGLGEEFLRCVDAALNHLKRHPEVGPLVHHDIRRTLIRRFPYSLFYLVEERELVILAVFHGRRRSEDWQERE
jgi:toxin ParE1/3/4